MAMDCKGVFVAIGTIAQKNDVAHRLLTFSVYVLLAMINCLHCVSVSSGDFGSTDPAIFGAAIPITAVVSIRCLYNRSVLAVTPSGCILILCLNFMKSIRLIKMNIYKLFF